MEANPGWRGWLLVIAVGALYVLMLPVFVIAWAYSAVTKLLGSGRLESMALSESQREMLESAQTDLKKAAWLIPDEGRTAAQAVCATAIFLAQGKLEAVLAEG